MKETRALRSGVETWAKTPSLSVLRMSASKSQGAGIFGHGAVVLMLAHPGLGEVEMGCGLCFIEGQGFLEVAHGGFVFPLQAIDGAEVVERVDVGGIALDGRGEGFAGVIHGAELHIRNAKLDVEAGIAVVVAQSKVIPVDGR